MDAKREIDWMDVHVSLKPRPSQEEKGKSDWVVSALRIERVSRVEIRLFCNDFYFNVHVHLFLLNWFWDIHVCFMDAHK
jgi:hypothetical protein